MRPVGLKDRGILLLSDRPLESVGHNADERVSVSWWWEAPAPEHEDVAHGMLQDRQAWAALVVLGERDDDAQSLGRIALIRLPVGTQKGT